MSTKVNKSESSTQNATHFSVPGLASSLWKRFVGVFRKKRMPDHLKRGRWGEQKAASFLKHQKKFLLVAKNWRHGKDEIDIVAIDRGVLVFVEVRTRRENALVTGYYSVNLRKKKSLCRVCRAYMRKLNDVPKHYRFDIIEVTHGAHGKARVTHHENVRLFPKRFKP